MRKAGCRKFTLCASLAAIRLCKQRGSSTNSPLPSSSPADPTSLSSCGHSAGGSLCHSWQGEISTQIHLAVAVFTSFTNRTNSIPPRTPPKRPICRNGNMEAGCCGHSHTDEDVDGAVVDAVRGHSCLSQPETRDGFTAATPPPFEEPRQLSWGQDDASKLHGKHRKNILVFNI